MNNWFPTDIPIGLTMALSENAKAFKNYSMLTIEEQNSIINKAAGASSKPEMISLVRELENRF